jgi:hypothetical protein
MSAGTGADQHQAVDAARRGLAGEGEVADVGEDFAPVGVHPGHHRRRTAERGDDQRWLVPIDELEFRAEPVVGAVGDEVEGPGAAGVRRRLAGRSVGGGDLPEPGVEDLEAARVRRGDGPGDPGAAGGDHEVRPGHQKHRRGDQRQPHPGPE